MLDRLDVWNNPCNAGGGGGGADQFDFGRILGQHGPVDVGRVGHGQADKTGDCDLHKFGTKSNLKCWNYGNDWAVVFAEPAKCHTKKSPYF